MKRWEYRNIHLLLAPVYLRMIGWCLRYRVTPFGLLKADYALDHGGATFASKYGIQMAFPQESFPPTAFLDGASQVEERVKRVLDFGQQYGFPIILKPDLGRVGLGVTLVHDENDIRRFVLSVSADYMVQQFDPGPLEFGVFYVRKNDVPEIFSINGKVFPSVTGDGAQNVKTLLSQHGRLSNFEGLFSTDRYQEVPAAGEVVQLSIVGSHTLGCVFEDATHLRTPQLLDAVHNAVGIAGFNYGRLDVRTPSLAAFQRGEFRIIEVNGVESLTTNAFDPAFSYRQGLQWFFRQYRLLVEIAAEHKNAHMEQLSLFEFARKVYQAESSINNIGSLLHLSSSNVDAKTTKPETTER